jgi:hypothetical protein
MMRIERQLVPALRPATGWSSTGRTSCVMAPKLVCAGLTPTDSLPVQLRRTGSAVAVRRPANDLRVVPLFMKEGGP